MNYNELSKEAQIKARKDYQDGWLETHSSPILDQEIHKILSLDLNDYYYDENGKYMSEEH